MRPCYCTSLNARLHTPHCYWRQDGALTDDELEEAYIAAREEVAKYIHRANAPKMLRAFIELWEQEK